MANIFDIPQINPLKFYQLSDMFNTSGYGSQVFASFDPNINDRGMDKDFFYRNLKDWMSKRTYFQPYQQGDYIFPQWTGVANYAGPVVNYFIWLVDCDGVIVKQASVPEGPEVGPGSGIFIREIQMMLYDVPEGKYFIQLFKMGVITDQNNYFVISEGIDLKRKHKNTMLIEYSNTVNDQGIFWETDIKMQFRIHGYKKLNPDSKFNAYEDQTLDQTMLSYVPFREWIFYFGIDGKPFPPYIYDKLNRILGCDTLRIDGVLYTLSDGAKFEVQEIQKYPLLTANITMREKINNQDTVVQPYLPIVLGAAPTSEWFFVEQINQVAPPTTYPVNKYFNGAVNFVNYLNTSLQFADSYYAIDTRGNIVLITTDASVHADFLPGFTFSTPYTGHLILELDTTLGTDLVVDYVNIPAMSSRYAYFWGDGATVFGIGTAANVPHTYAANGKFKAFLFWNKVQNLALDASHPIIKTIEGKLPQQTITFAALNNIIERIKNNIFDKTAVGGVGFISSIDLTNNRIPTTNINELLMYFYEALLAGSLAAGLGGSDLQSQTPLAPPTNDPGLGFFRGALLSAGFNVLTD